MLASIGSRGWAVAVGPDLAFLSPDPALMAKAALELADVS